MSKSNVAFLLLLRALLVGAAGLTLFTTAHAQSRIGVTQATENKPIGKPPGGVDRVLRVGTDVQANEIISTAANDRAHLVFLDGTTLTIGPSSQLTVDKFVYDPTTQKGELAVNATKGVFRVIGGRISKTSAITVTTPSATMGIRGGIMVFGVQASATTSIFVYGNSMTVTANGVTQTVTVPGLSVSTPTGGTPGAPTIVVQGDLAAALANLAGNNTAAAATVDAINTLVANNLGNPLTLAALIQAIVVANTPTPITTTTTTTTLTVTVVENPNQTQS
ncbi:MAG TPA: FecR domain-containing protein, partial [Reyranella sp.]